MRHPHRAVPACLALALLAAPAARAADPILYRPMMADARETTSRARAYSFTEDYRYGSDITDSTSTGGWQLGVEGTAWGLGAGKIFRAPVWESMFGWRGPWKLYQLSAAGLIVTNFDRIEAQLVDVSDYQFGGALEMQWSGEGTTADGVTSYRRPVLTTRTGLYHRSSHVGDEYVARGDFGDNQTGPGAAAGLSPHPAVKRTTLSYEVLDQFLALEWTPLATATVRLYGGGEWVVGISGVKPAHFRTPAAEFGFEWRSAGNRPDLPAGTVARWANALLGGDRLASSWFAAVNLRYAKPLDFAGADNPAGPGEVWTPSLWTPASDAQPFGGYAGSWHAMFGLSLWRPSSRDVSRGGKLTGPETLLTLDWYRGYSPYGPFLDSRREEHPRWYIVPGITMLF